MMMHTFTDSEDNFIITSPTYPIFKQSTLPPFLAYMDGLGIYDRKEECFRMFNGGTCWFRTGKNPDSVVGITSVRAILCDEAGLYSLYFWENIQGRSSFCRAPIRIVTSPYAMNWLYKDFIKPIKRDPSYMPDVQVIQASSRENPYFSPEEYDEKKRTMNPRRFNMMYGGQFDKMEGLIYDCFHEDLNGEDPFAFPNDMEFFGGIDWGFTHPFALSIHGILPSGYRFQVSETKQAGLSIEKIGDICEMKKKIFGVKRFYAGPDRPENIAYLNGRGITTVAANNDVQYGIDILWELINQRRYKIFKGTGKHTLDELDTYRYPDPKDLKPNQDDKEKGPVKQNDDMMDANRYVVVMTHRSSIKLRPSVPTHKIDLSEEEKIRSLMKHRRAS